MRIAASTWQTPISSARPRDLLDDDYLHARSLLISANRSLGVASPGDPARREARARELAYGRDTAPEFESTSQIAIVDRDGNAVSMTTIDRRSDSAAA